RILAQQIDDSRQAERLVERNAHVKEQERDASFAPDMEWRGTRERAADGDSGDAPGVATERHPGFEVDAEPERPDREERVEPEPAMHAEAGGRGVKLRFCSELPGIGREPIIAFEGYAGIIAVAEPDGHPAQRGKTGRWRKM